MRDHSTSTSLARSSRGVRRSVLVANSSVSSPRRVRASSWSCDSHASCIIVTCLMVPATPRGDGVRACVKCESEAGSGRGGAIGARGASNSAIHMARCAWYCTHKERLHVCTDRVQEARTVSRALTCGHDLHVKVVVAAAFLRRPWPPAGFQPHHSGLGLPHGVSLVGGSHEVVGSSSTTAAVPTPRLRRRVCACSRFGLDRQSSGATAPGGRCELLPTLLQHHQQPPVPCRRAWPIPLELHARTALQLQRARERARSCRDRSTPQLCGGDRE